MLKNLIVQFGELIFNALVILGLIIAVIGGFTAMQYSFFAGLLTLVSGVAGVILLAFVIYLLIDIRDNLKLISHNS